MVQLGFTRSRRSGDDQKEACYMSQSTVGNGRRMYLPCSPNCFTQTVSFPIGPYQTVELVSVYTHASRSGTTVLPYGT